MPRHDSADTPEWQPILEGNLKGGVRLKGADRQPENERPGDRPADILAFNPGLSQQLAPNSRQAKPMALQ